KGVNKMNIKSSNRWKRLYFNNKGSYFNYNGNRWYLDNFIRIDDPKWHGSAHLTNTCGMLIKINDTVEAVQTALVY
ncbi:MAG: hypothetical protein ACO3UU_14630, partial [Minisyncoccia bacterium]